MSTLLVVAYDSEFKAEEMRLQLMKMQKDYLLSVEDAVVAKKNKKGKVKLNQIYHLTAAGAASGGFWGLLIGMIFLNPLLGFAVGAGAGTVSGALSDIGINDKFMKDVAQNLTENSSMLFLLLDNIVFDKVLDELKGTGGTIIQTSLSHTDEARFKEAIKQEENVKVEENIE